MKAEFRRGREVLESGESEEGARRFAAGAGRHGGGGAARPTDGKRS